MLVHLVGPRIDLCQSGHKESPAGAGLKATGEIGELPMTVDKLAPKIGEVISVNTINSVCWSICYR